MSDFSTEALNPVDEIRFVMQSEVWEVTPKLQESAKLYVEACHDVNQRLRRCDELLRKGLRSEAIQLAEAEPNLLDELARLDFPERDDWLQAVSVYDLPGPEQLLVDVAQDLNAAYAQEQPLEKLLSRHRLLALARAPLSERIAVMRRIAEKDATSPFWVEDLRTFEQARLREIEGEARQAAGRKDVAALAKLREELSASGWREPVPKAIVANVKQLAGSVERNTAREELKSLAEDLERAFSEFNLAAARPLRDRWSSLVQTANLAESEPLAQQVGPILGWIADADKIEQQDADFQSAVAALERSLDGEPTLVELSQRLEQVRKFERELPLPLATRASHRLESLELARRRLRRVQVGFIAVLALVGVGFVGFLVQRQLASANEERLAAAIDQLIESGHLADARTMLDGAGDVTQSDRLVAIHQRLVDQERTERERTTGLQAALRLATDATGPDEAQRHLEAARPLARSPEEKLALTQLDQAWDTRRRTALAEAERTFRAELEAVTEEVQRLGPLVEDSPELPETSRVLSDLTPRLARLAGMAQPLRPELANQVKLLESRRQASVEFRDRLLRERAAEMEVTALAHIPTDHPDPEAALAAFSQAMTAYANVLGESEVTKALRESATETLLATPVLQWQRLRTSWSEPFPASGDLLQERLTKCQDLLRVHPSCPDAAIVTEYVDTVQAIIDRNRPGDGLKAKLERAFSHHLLIDPQCLQTKSGTLYYLARLSDKDNIDFTGKESFTIRYFTGFQMLEEDTRTQLLTRGDLATPTTFRPAQHAIAQAVRDRVSRLKTEEWEPHLLDLAESIRTARDMHEYLRFDLLKRVLEAARNGSPSLAKPLQPHLQLLSGAGFNPAVNWMDPRDADATQAAIDAKILLARLPPLESAAQAASQSRQALMGQMSQLGFPIGWLTKAEGQWVLRTAWRPASGSYSLRVIYPGQTGGKGEWRTVGEATLESVQLRSTANTFMQPGRLVFAMKEVSETARDSGTRVDQ